MSNIYKKPKLSAAKGKSGHDVSQRRIYSCPVGMMLPVWNDIANPGDKYHLNTSAFIRTEAVETSAFIRMKYHVDWFFVPMTQLYQFWNEFYNQTNDVNTSFVTNQQTNYQFPYFDIYKSIFFEGQSYFTQPFQDANHLGLVPDEMGIPRAWNMRRLYDLFGYGSVDTILPAANDSTRIFHTLGLKYLAYHKIFYSHYNKTDWQKNDPSMYNVDKYAGTKINSGNDEVRQNLLNRIVSTIHYRPYRPDYFNSIQPAPTFNSSFANAAITRTSGNYVAPGQEDMQHRTFDYNILDKFQGDEPNDGDLTELAKSVGINVNLSNVQTLSAGDIRSMFALDRFLRITANAGSHYDQQTLAHFGVKLPEGIKNEAYRLGSQVTDININEVVASASTGATENGVALAGSTIGDIAGKGFGSTPNSKDINFTAPCHGIIMAIASIEPISDYASMGCELDNRIIETYDFYHPEFDNLGMEPAFNAFFNYNYIGAASNASQINGWHYRYWMFKSKFDVVNESVWNTYRNSWVGYKQMSYAYDPIRPRAVPSIQQLFYICPQYTNNIFLLPVPMYPTAESLVYDKTEGSEWDNPVNSAQNIFKSDNFLINLDVKAFKSSIMSTYSLPNT